MIRKGAESMQTERLSATIYLAIVLLFFYLFYKVMSPFLVTIAWAMVMSITFYPVYRLFLRFIRRSWIASLSTLLIILIVIFGPFSFIISSLAGEITDIYSAIEKEGIETLTNIQSHPFLQKLVGQLSSYRVLQDFNLQEGIVSTLKGAGEYIVKHVSDFFKNAVILAFNFIIMCLTIYYFLKDGETLTEYLKKLLPFSEEQKARLTERVKETVIAAVYGQLSVGVAQGALGGAAFWALGISSPVFWGTVMAILSFLPLVGTFLIWGPASVILVLTGSYGKGTGLFLFGALIISSVDNILKPLIIGGKTKIHTLLVFFSVLGGIKFLGFLGFILGPLIAALCLSLFDMYTEEA
ncbi:MAG: AI-2E family transporter [Nitrospiraceae bacterium]|nr:MAG: AI-2E family transporter [Nitrospiraceae bacterium]